MKSLSAYLNDDTNQFGPGTDLIVSMLAVLLVVTLVSSRMYSAEKEKNDALGGNFRLAAESFPAADFFARPVTKLVNPAQTEARVGQIVDEYRRGARDFAYIFVIGHSNRLDDPHAEDRSRPARLQRNWNYASRRAALIAALIERHLTDEQRDNVVVTTTGEFDMRDPTAPQSQENAWVEVVFGRAWKPPSRLRPRSPSSVDSGRGARVKGVGGAWEPR